ncbi:uncharacterized protein [Prorops nasuta]|uniref:uncharacterized protein n=1 Tax=Prorops nasuta TaxID=863751 RepID=UPI0034CF500C
MATRPKQDVEEMKEEISRSLQIRLPHKITDKTQVEELFNCEVTVTLRRQTDRSCRVIFPSIKEKLINLKLVNEKRINDRPIIAKELNVCLPLEKIKQRPKRKKKKVIMPIVKPEPKYTRVLHISNIKCGTKSIAVKGALKGCTSVKLLKPKNNLRTAIVKLESVQVAKEYLTKIHEWPCIEGNQLKISADKRKRQKKNKSKPLKIFNQ